MNIYSKIKLKYKIIILNIFVLISVYFFSFNIFPKIISNHQYNYQSIKINVKNINEINFIIQKLQLGSDGYFINDNEKFLKEFTEQLSKSSIIAEKTPCPSELLRNKMRNINVYFTEQNKKNFNVRFYANKFFGSSIDKFNMDLCFNYIFVDNLNKFYNKKFKDYINNLEENYFFYLHEYNIKFLELSFSAFISEIEKGNITSVKIGSNLIEGTFVNGEIFITNLPDNFNIIQKLLDEKVNVLTAEPNELFYIVNEITSLKNKVEYLKKFLKPTANFFFIDPNVNYKHEEKIEKIYWQKIWAFIICMITIIIIQIAYYKFGKKKISRLINKFIEI
jgi:hypothetical protein